MELQVRWFSLMVMKSRTMVLIKTAMASLTLMLMKMALEHKSMWASFNIVGTQLMTVNQKTKEISLLKALGATRWMVRRIFLIQGLIVSSIGATLGAVVGLLVCGLLIVVGYPLEPEVYLIDQLPVSIEAVEVVLAVMATLLLTFVATLYSAGRAGRLMPVEGIRYVE